MFETIGYKNGFIHIKNVTGKEVIEVQFANYNIRECKSIRSAKNLITRDINKTL